MKASRKFLLTPFLLLAAASAMPPTAVPARLRHGRGRSAAMTDNAFAGANNPATAAGRATASSRGRTVHAGRSLKWRHRRCDSNLSAPEFIQPRISDKLGGGYRVRQRRHEHRLSGQFLRRHAASGINCAADSGPDRGLQDQRQPSVGVSPCWCTKSSRQKDSPICWLSASAVR